MSGTSSARRGRERIRQIVERINQRQYQNPEMETLLLQLSKRLAQHKGKKQYGYLNTGSKKIADAIVAVLASDSRIQELYELWYEQKEDILRTYTNTFPERVPLEQNKEFKPIRNAVVQAALELTAEPIPSTEEAPLSPPCAPIVQVSPPASDVSTPAPQVAPMSPPVQESQASSAIARLIQHLARLLQDSAEQNFQKRQSIDRKLRRQIEEKK